LKSHSEGEEAQCRWHSEEEKQKKPQPETEATREGCRKRTKFNNKKAEEQKARI